MRAEVEGEGLEVIVIPLAFFSEEYSFLVRFSSCSHFENALSDLRFPSDW